jgi:purine-binding chemotaxis protein CheW
MSEPSLILCCAGRSYALPLALVVEVTRVVAPALLLPRAPRYCLGVVDYHGQMVPMVDLGARLGLCPPRPITAFVNGRLVVTELPGGRFAFVVDEVPELCEKPVEPLTTVEPSLAGLVLGVVRWRDGAAAPLLPSGALLPVGASARLRQLMAALLADEPSTPIGKRGDTGAPA